MRRASAPRWGASSPHSYDWVILQQTDAATKLFHCWQSVMIRASIHFLSLMALTGDDPHLGRPQGSPPHIHVLPRPYSCPLAARSSSTFLRSSWRRVRRTSTSLRHVL